MRSQLAARGFVQILRALWRGIARVIEATPVRLTCRREGHNRPNTSSSSSLPRSSCVRVRVRKRGGAGRRPAECYLRHPFLSSPLCHTPWPLPLTVQLDKHRRSPSLFPLAPPPPPPPLASCGPVSFLPDPKTLLTTHGSPRSGASCEGRTGIDERHVGRLAGSCLRGLVALQMASGERRSSGPCPLCSRGSWCPLVCVTKGRVGGSLIGRWGGGGGREA